MNTTSFRVGAHSLLRFAARCGLASFCLLALVSIRAQLQPEIIFKDTFDVSEHAHDINFGNDKRQTGLAAPLTYAVNDNGGTGFAELGEDDAKNLRLSSPIYISPNHNFVEGGTFTIEFDVNPGIDDDPGDQLSPDWCGIVFGSSTQNPFIFSSDGMGILFRNNGGIEVWETQGQGPIYSGSGDFPGGIPTDRSFHVRIEVETANFKGSPATVRMFVDDVQVRIDRNSLEHVKATGFTANYITLESLGFPGPWIHVFDNLSVKAVPCVDVAPQFVDKIIGQVSDPITITIPGQLNATKAAAVVVTSQNPAVAIPTGADANGRLVLNFAAGGATSQSFTVNAVGAGTTTLDVSAEGACVNGSLRVNVAAGVGLAEVVFQDTFNTSDNSFDINFENNSGRQSGTAGVLSYVESAASAAGGPADEFTQVNNFDYPGRLLIINQGNGVSPDYNFIDGPQFTIEFEVEPGANNPDRTSDNWAAIVFGSPGRNRFVISGDGMGILFRNDGRIEVWDGSSRVFGSDFADALPAGPLKVRIEARTADFSGNSPATITMFVNDQQVRLNPNSLEHVRAAGFRGNYITLLGIGEGLVHTFENLKVSALACAHFNEQVVNLGPATPAYLVMVKIPAAMNATKAASVKVTSRNPGVAIPDGAVDGSVTLNFGSGAPVSQGMVIRAVGKGRTVFDLTNNEGVCVGDPLVVNVTSTLLVNPSFEFNYDPNGAHYSAIDAWETRGGTGLNRISGPFHDNGSIPDRTQIAFLQGTAGAAQTISGLTAGKRYWIQFRYNSRNCCGAFPDLAVNWNDTELDKITDIRTVGGLNQYYSRTIVFVPEQSSGRLEFAASAAGDATALIDAVTIVQRDDGNVVVHNPSFEASGEPPFPGYINPGSISGWTGTGGYGVNFTGGGPFADNGTAPDQDYVAFIQGTGASLSQRLFGLVAGETYTVSYAYNARSGNQPHLKVTAGDAVIQDEDVTPVGGVAPYLVKSATFTAPDSNVLLTFAQTADGDHTILLDDIKVLGRALVIPPIKVTPTAFEIDVAQMGNLVTVTVPPQLIASSSATVTVTSQNPAVAVPGGSADGVLDLVFTAGGETEKTFEVTPKGAGSTRLILSNRLGAQFDNDQISVLVSSSYVRNPSFENNSHPGFPGYGPINGWAGSGPGNTGINNSGGPFHDNGTIPDRAQIALLQVDKTITQTIFRLVAGKQYWLQFYYNTRNCCGGSIDLIPRFAGTDLDLISTLIPVGGANPYNFKSIAFTPNGDTGDLEFSTISAGDATALLDGVNIVQRDPGNVVVQNPSFEASGIPPFPGYIQPNQIAGWKGTGNYGVNASGPGPFADNGKNPDQESVAFIQGQNSSLSQEISGLTVGQRYTLSYSYNARGGNQPRLTVTIGGATAQDDTVTPVGGSNPYPVNSFGFTADAETMTLTFTQTAAGDNTALIDNVMITEGAAPPPVRLNVQLLPANVVRISWPASETGFEVQIADQVTGPWNNSGLPETIEGNDRVVRDGATGSARFYRLRKN
jgi:hypothetical protein